MDEAEDTSGANEVPFNKKLTLYVVDAGPSMFVNAKTPDCPFRKALKVVYHQLINISCTGSFSHLVGVIIANTEISKNRLNQKFSYELIELNVPSKEDLGKIKTLIDAEDILEAFLAQFGGHAEVNLANLMWSCKKMMSMAASSSRHHIIVYLSNLPNPFKNDEKAYTRLSTILTDFCKHSYVDKKGMRRVNKTPGEFHVLMMSETVSAEDEERWKEISNSFYVGDVDDLDLQAYKRTYTQRAFSKLILEVGPNIRFGVSVYTLARDATLQKKTILENLTEVPLDSRVTYINKDETLEYMRAEDSSKLQKAVKIGGKTIYVDSNEMKDLTDFDAKGVALLGFKAIDELDIFGDHIATPQFLIPNEDDVLGSTQLFRALHEKCFERKMAMICRFQSRSNQKIRLIALVPEKKGEIPMNSNNEESTVHGYKNDGFYVIYLPYAEDVRNFGKKLECPEGQEWPVPDDSDLDVTRKFIRNLKKPYAPETFANPRFLSFYSMITEAAIGERIPIKDTIEPYFKTRSQDFTNKLKTPLQNHFDLSEQDESKESDTSRPSAKRQRLDHSTDDDQSTLQLIRTGKFDKVKVTDLKKFINDYMPQQSVNLKKAELADKISQFLETNDPF